MNPEVVAFPNNVAAFVLKLWRLVEDSNVDDMISWSKGGTAFCVHDPNRFAKDVLPYYFKHSNFTSFVRQLNMYGFKKLISTDHGGIKSENPEWEFHHQYFRQGKVELLEHVKRKVHPEERKVKSEDVTHILDDVQQLQTKHGVIQNQFESLKMQNEMLWQELSELRIKHRKQQHVLNKLIKFLILIYGGKGIGSGKRLAIESGQSSSKRRRSGPQYQAQIEELENLKYVVESPRPADDFLSQLEAEPTNTGPQITLLPDEPLVQDVPSSPVIVTSKPKANSAIKGMAPSKSESKESKVKSKKSNNSSLKLKMPTMVTLSKEPTLDFSPSIFENMHQGFTPNADVSNRAAVSESLEELENSFNPAGAVVLKRPVSTDKDFIDQDVDHITSGLGSLQSLLAGPQFNLDPDTVRQLFHPDETLPVDNSLPFAISDDTDEATAVQKMLDKDGSNEIGDSEDIVDRLSPFSPGMFLNEMGESSNDKPENSRDLEEDSLL